MQTAIDWIRTANHWRQKQPLCQLCHSYCPKLFYFTKLLVLSQSLALFGLCISDKNLLISKNTENPARFRSLNLK